MQSVYKLPIAMAVLHRVDAGELKLDSLVDVRPRDFVTRGQHSPVRDAHPEGVRGARQPDRARKPGCLRCLLGSAVKSSPTRGFTPNECPCRRE